MPEQDEKDDWLGDLHTLLVAKPWKIHTFLDLMLCKHCNWSLELFYEFYALGETARYQRNHTLQFTLLFWLSVDCLPAWCCFFNDIVVFFALFWFLRMVFVSCCQSGAVFVQDNSHLRRVKNWAAQPQWRQSPAFDIPAAELQRGLSIYIYICVVYCVYIYIYILYIHC